MQMARVAGLWTSPAKGSGRMDARDRVRAIEGHGLEGCAHARAGTKRQVLFASAEHLDALGVEYGRIRENFTIEGDDVHTWPVGPLEDPRLALDPPAVRLLDVVPAGREDVEDEPPVGEE